MGANNCLDQTEQCEISDDISAILDFGGRVCGAPPQN